MGVPHGTPRSSVLIGFFHYKPTILGHPHDYGNPHLTTALVSGSI